MEYILQCCRKMQEDRIKCMEPKQNVTTQLNLYMDAWHTKASVSFVWLDGPCADSRVVKYLGRGLQIMV